MSKWIKIKENELDLITHYAREYLQGKVIDTKKFDITPSHCLKAGVFNNQNG